MGFHLDYYFIDEVARILGIRPRSVYVLIKKGKLETRKKHDMTVIPKSSLEALFESGYKPKRKRDGAIPIYSLHEVMERGDMPNAEIYERRKNEHRQAEAGDLYADYTTRGRKPRVTRDEEAFKDIVR